MGSIDFKASRGTLSLALVISAIAGGGTSALTAKVWGPGGGWEEMVKQSAVLSQEMSHVVEELKEIASNTKSQTDLAHSHTTSIAELKLRMQNLEAEYNRLLSRLP